MFYNKVKEYRVEYLLVVITAFLQFFRLGMGDIQQWDESLYTIRAEACVKFGAWFDQTAYSAGGLYSATHPPFGIWLIAAGKYFLGDSSFALRLSAACCAILSLFVFYKVCRLFFDKSVALMGVVVFGNAQIFLWFAHHAQTDIPMHTFVLVCVYFALKYLCREGNRNIFFAGLFFGLALLTKAYVALYALPFLMLLPLIFRRKDLGMKMVYIALLGIIIASPWYVFMEINHAGFISRLGESIVSLSSAEYSRGEHTAKWYYLNQLIINYPFILAIFFLPVGRALKKYYPPEQLKDAKKLFAASFIWLVSMFVLFTLVKSKFPHFFLFLAIPASLVVTYIFDVLSRGSASGWRNIASIVLMIGALGWSASEHLRRLIKGFQPDIHLIDFKAALPLALVSLIFFVLIFQSKKSVISKLLSALILMLVCGNVYRWSEKSEDVFVSGVKDVVAVLDQNTSVKNILLLHSAAPHGELLPQFAYYSGGWNLNWDEQKKSTTMNWEEGKSLFLSEDTSRFDAVVVHRSWDRYFVPSHAELELQSTLDSLIHSRYPNVLRVQQYALYRR